MKQTGVRRLLDWIGDRCDKSIWWGIAATVTFPLWGVLPLALPVLAVLYLPWRWLVGGLMVMLVGLLILVVRVARGVKILDARIASVERISGRE